MKNKDLPSLELTVLLIGELAVALLTCLVYYIVSIFVDSVTFDYKVITGAVLGATVIFLNFLFLALSTAKVLREAREARGTREMTDEEIDTFVKEHQRRYDVKVKTSFFIRNISMILTLVLAFLLDCFDVIATLVPLVMYRPILSLAGIIQSKRANNISNDNGADSNVGNDNNSNEGKENT